MKRASIAVAVLAALLLTGCAGTVEEPASEPRGFVQSVPSETPQPLVAETPAATAPDDVDAEFVAYVRAELALLPVTGITDATDEQLVTAGKDACVQLLDGVDSESIRLIEGEEATAGGYFTDSGTIIDGARRYYCPETIY